MTKQELQNQKQEFEIKKNEVLERYQKYMDDFTNLINTTFNLLSTKEVKVRAQISDYVIGFGNKSPYEVRLYVDFVDPTAKYGVNFGSNFDVTVYDDRITVNHGTIGTFDHSEIYQIARLQLLTKLFEKEDYLVSLVKQNVNLDIIKELDDARNELSDVIYKIQSIERQEERDNAIASIKSNKYLVVKDYWSKFNGTHTIEKVTDKSVLVRNAYGEQKRFDLNTIIYHLHNDGSTYILTNSLQ